MQLVGALAGRMHWDWEAGGGAGGRGSKSEFVTAHGTERPTLGQPRKYQTVEWYVDGRMIQVGWR